MKNKLTIGLVSGLLIALMLSACQPEPRSLTVLTHDSFAISEEVIRQFEEENNIEVNFVLSGDTGSSLNKMILTKDAPLGDIFYGVDNSFLSRALEEDIFAVYDSPVLAEVPEEFKLDVGNRALPIDYGDICINYDKAYFAENSLAVPEDLDDLLKPEYEGLLVVENPAVSSPGLSFLFATIHQYGEDGYLDYWQALKENGAVIVNDWETAYYSNFSASSGMGLQPMVVSYATSPAAEVIFATDERDESPTASIVGDGACYRQIEFAGILKNSKNRELAEKFLDYMLSATFQEDIPMNMFVLPVNSNAQLPEEFVKYIQTPENPAMLPAETIAQMRDAWVTAWQEAILD